MYKTYLIRAQFRTVVVVIPRRRRFQQVAAGPYVLLYSIFFLIIVTPTFHSRASIFIVYISAIRSHK